MEKLGFIGLGIMGKPMAARLLAKGYSLLVNDLDEKRAEDLLPMGAGYASTQEIGAECDIVFTILPNGAIVKQVLFGRNGVADALKPGSLVVDMSSVLPQESKYCAKELRDRQCAFLDSPVSGGEAGAKNGTLAFMSGGERVHFLRAKPYFEAMGTSAILTGPVGSGSVTKLVNQIIVNLNIAAVSEGMVFAQKMGVDPGVVYRAIRGGLAGSAVLDAKAPAICARNFRPGGKISINHKDIRNVLLTAHEADIPLPFTAQLFEVLQTLKVWGDQNDDHCGIVKYFECLSQVEVSSDLCVE